eukprot:159236-Pleurochrysis_carterae.AAC.1
MTANEPKNTKQASAGAVAAAATTTATGKTKSCTPFQPEVGQDVWARWMVNKRHQIPPRGGRGLCGKTFPAV